MKHNVTPPTAADDAQPDKVDTPIGIDHPTVDVEIPRTYETVEPEYDIIVAARPQPYFDDLTDTKVSRLERVIKANEAPSHDDIMQTISDAVVSFEREYQTGDFDPLLESVHIRSVGDEDALCVHLRETYGKRDLLSRLLMAVDEALRPLVQPGS